MGRTRAGGYDETSRRICPDFNRGDTLIVLYMDGRAWEVKQIADYRIIGWDEGLSDWYIRLDREDAEALQDILKIDQNAIMVNREYAHMPSTPDGKIKMKDFQPILKQWYTTPRSMHYFKLSDMLAERVRIREE